MAHVQGWVPGEPFCRDQEMEAGTGHLGRMRITSEADVTDDIDRLLGKITNYDVLASGTLGALNATLEIAGAGLSTVGVGISGTWVGTIVAEITTGDGVWDIIPLIDNTMGSAGLTTAVNGNFLLGVAGALTLRIRMSAYTSGTATIYLEGSSAPAGVFLSRSIPTGINSIGAVSQGAAGSEAWLFDFPTQALSVAASTAASSGDNTLVAAPGAGKRLVLVAYTLQNESSTATTMILYDGPSTDAKPIARILGQNQGDGVSKVLPAGHMKPLTENKALVLNLSGANSCGYTAWYYTEDV
jgi:hypothetical protein